MNVLANVVYIIEMLYGIILCWTYELFQLFFCQYSINKSYSNNHIKKFKLIVQIYELYTYIIL